MLMTPRTRHANFIDECAAYARWWRDTPAPAREAEACARIAPARAASLWYQHRGLDPYQPLPSGAPPLSRHHVQAFAGAFIGDRDALSRAGYLGRTSGSSGEPVEVMMCAWAMAHYYVHLEHALGTIGHTLPDSPRLMHLSIATGACHDEEAAPLWGGRVGRFDVSDVTQAVTRIETWRPDLLALTPQVLEALLPALSAALHKPLTVLCTSETLTEALVDAARLAWGDVSKTIVFIDSYGLSEIGPVAHRCLGGAHMWHVPVGSSIVEQLDGGAMAITTLRNRAMPLTRYLSGDRIEGLHHGKCPRCTHEGQSFSRLEGRAAFVVRDVRGVARSPVPWRRLLQAPRHGIRRFMLCQDVPGELVVSVEPSPEEINYFDELCDALSAIDPHVNVRFGAWRSK